MKNEKVANEKDSLASNATGFRFPLELTLVALGLGLAVELLFDDHPPGISFPIWAGLCIAALLLTSGREGVKASRAELMLTIPILFFSILSSVRLEPLTVFLDILLTLLLFTLWVRTYRIGGLIDFGWFEFGLATVMVPLEAWVRPWPVARIAWIRLAGERGARSRSMAALRGVLLAIPILVVFLALLTSADLVFADAVQDALQWLDLERLARWFRGALVVIFSGLFFLGALVLALQDLEKRSSLSLERPPVSPFLGFIEAMVVLGAVDLLFIIFVVIQFAYLFGGDANITAAGYTYSEYARRGFGELVAVAFLSLGLIYALSALTKREDRSRTHWFNGLSVALVGLVGVILTSALKRLLLYENAYGFTRLRTYTHVAIFWMGAVFIAFLITLLTGRLRRFVPLVVLAICGFVATLSLLNIDAFIVDRNVDRYVATGQLDIHYLMSLSEDAIPGIVRFVGEAPEGVRGELLAQLACREVALGSSVEQLSWQSYNFSRGSASRWLGTLEDELGIFVVEPEGRGWSVKGPDLNIRCVQPWD